mgnify:CR=1 FL=1
MELKDKLQNLSKHSERRRTSPLSCLAVFLCRGKCRADRFDSCTRLCDVRFAAYQLGVAVGSAHRLYIANGTKTQISADLPEQQTKIDSAIYI